MLASVIPDHSPFSFSRETFMTFSRYPFKKVTCYKSWTWGLL
jgi:hypothetical protein